MGYRAIFHSEFYQRRLERSVLGFGSALPPSLSLSLFVSPYVRLDPSVCGPRNVVEASRPSSSSSTDSPSSSFEARLSLPSHGALLSLVSPSFSLAASRHTSLSLGKRNVGCFEESVSSVIPKRY